MPFTTTVPGVPAEWIETNWFNHYGEAVVDNVLVDAYEPTRTYYRCKDEHWRAAFKAWQKASRTDRSAPEPISEGHCMFIRPASYSSVPANATGEARRLATRRVIRNRVVSMLNGWDRDMRQSPEGMRTLAKIVRSTVKARMSGQDTGASPFVACVYATL